MLLCWKQQTVAFTNEPMVSKNSLMVILSQRVRLHLPSFAILQYGCFKVRIAARHGSDQPTQRELGVKTGRGKTPHTPLLLSYAHFQGKYKIRKVMCSVCKRTQEGDFHIYTEGFDILLLDVWSL